MKIKSFISVLLAAGICLSCIGCTQTPEGADDTTTAEESVSETVGEEIRYTYKTKYVDVEFVSDEQREEWRSALTSLLNNEKSRVYSKGGDLIGYNYTYPDRPCIEIGYELTLFDINTDGTPELLVNTGGGSSGNACYCVYDIISGKEIGNMSGGHSDSWCIYFNRKTGKFEAIGQFELRIGWMGKSRYVNKAVIADTMAWHEECLYETTWMYAQYEIDAVEVEVEDEALQENFDFAWEEMYPGVWFEVNGDRAYIEEYFAAQDDFVKNYVRIDETGIQLISWSDVVDDDDDVATKAEKMAEALLSSNQQFIAAKTE